MPRRTAYPHGSLRNSLIDTTATLIAEKGVEALSVAEVTRRLGVSGSAPYQHFPGRDVLLAATAARAGRELAASMESAASAACRRSNVEVDAAEGLSAAVGAYAEFVVHRRVGFEFIFADELTGLRHIELAEAGRAVMAVLLPLATSVVDDPLAALRLVQQCIAAAHGLSTLYIKGSAQGAVRNISAVTAEAAQITRTLSAAFSGRASERTQDESRVCASTGPHVPPSRRAPSIFGIG